MTKCPQCGSKECGPISCRMYGRKHNAAPQDHRADSGSPAQQGSLESVPAVAAPDIGYECAWLT